MNALQFVVEGRQQLSGTIRPSGNKNAALPIICAALLTEQPVFLENVPRIRDVENLVELVRSAGADAAWTGQNSLRIHAKTVHSAQLDPVLCRKIRASILLAGPLLARCGEIELPPPGGDVIGRRRVDTHFLALERLGASFELNDHFHLSTPGLRGSDVFLDEPSVTGTENALMAAVAATGTTVLRNAASEPHVQDLCHFLVALGAEYRDNLAESVIRVTRGESPQFLKRFPRGGDSRAGLAAEKAFLETELLRPHPVFVLQLFRDVHRIRRGTGEAGRMDVLRERDERLRLADPDRDDRRAETLGRKVIR